ncbi:unnamed protein product [Blepharisma stoltei]|uniref:TNFR-Cys domain-containing protein n=1 Tax=Blepharisma stoltei TaxID=1481888 RepID=A0AAU9KBZ1_9CILI|nr:unnamed protein product [Blepharisma stoltei]
MKLLVLNFVSFLLFTYSACPKNSISGSCVDANYSLMIDGKVCAEICPSKFTPVCTTTGTTVCTACSLPTSPILFQLDFSAAQDLTATYISNLISPGQHFNTPGGTLFGSSSKNAPLPTVDRGFYFDSASSLSRTPGYIAALYFTANIWIHPLSSGQILTFYYNSGYYIECVAEATTFVLKVILQNSNDSGETKVTAYSDPYTSAWQTVSFQLEQASCNQVNLKIYINSNPVVTTFYNYEANFPVDQTDKNIWKIGKLVGGDAPDSFKGFLYWMEARNDLTINYATMTAKLECKNKQYWDGTSCQNCSSACPSWPWCIRGDSCSTCNTVSCGSCTGYSASMCTSCTTGSLPYCCDMLASACTSTWQSTSCTNGISPINGICLYGCPYGFGNCSPVSTPVITIDFTDDFAGIYDNVFVTGSDPLSYNFWNSPEIFDPFPAKWRGLYFIGFTYLKGQIDLSPTLSFGAWVYLISGSWIGHSYSNFLLNSNGFFQTYMQKYDGSIQLLTSSMATPLWQWSYISYSFGFSNGVSTVTPYLNNAHAAASSTSDHIFRPFSGGYLYLGTGDFNGFISYFQLWGVTITDFTNALNYYNCNIGTDVECLWNCDYDYYFDGASCEQCLISCQNGCVRANSCNICETDKCQKCSSFSSNSCTLCIPHASNSTCDCDSGFFQPSGQALCSQCYNLCVDCSGGFYTQCTSCISGYFMLQNICSLFCPTGYILNNNICEIDMNYSGFVFNLKPHQIKNIVNDLQNNIPVLTGKDNTFYPNYGITDPYAAIYRGYYFTGTSYMQLPPYLSTPSPLLTFSPQFAIATWIKPISGTGVIFCKQTDNGAFTKYVSFELINKYPSLTLTLKDSSTVTYIGTNASLQVTLAQWVFISATSGISSTPEQTISFTMNSFSDISSDLGDSWLEDLESSFFISIGARHLDSTHFSSFFNGFLWDMKIYNTLAIPILTEGSCNGCSLCPNDNSNICLDNCLIGSFWNGNSCASCLSGCSNSGCVRKDKSCNHCQDVVCELCDDYTSTCITCKSNASLIGSSCQCNVGFYWNIDNESCDACDASCKSCTSSKYLDCLACANGLYLVSGICLASCPQGYSRSGTKCVQTQEKIFDLDLNTLEGVIYDKANSIPVITGSTKQFYPNYENDDPIPAYLRGFYFNGWSSILRLPEYSSYISPKLVIAPIFTISIWLNTETSFSTIISKNDISNNLSTLWAVYLMNSKPALSIIISSSAIAYTCQTALKNNEWNHVSFTLEITTDGNSMASCYIKGNFDSSAIVNYGYFQDRSSNTAMTIGAQISSDSLYNFHQGFIYIIQIFNGVKPISKLSTTACTESCGVCPTNQICIPNCKINEYWSGPSYNSCYQCNIKCKKSCRNWRSTCSLCDNLLCEICTNYSETGCETCKINAINPDSCICDTNFVLDGSTNSTCVQIQSGGYKGPDGKFYSCPNLCISCESQIKCTACVDNASLYNDLCYCNIGYNGISNCTLVSFWAKLTVLSDNSLYLSFSDTLANNLTASDFIITIKKYDVSWKIEQVNDTSYYITLDLEEIIPKGTSATLEFLNLAELRSVSNGILNTSEISVSLNYYDPAPYSSTIEGIRSQTTTGTLAIVSTAAALSIMSLSPSSLWSMMNTLQILSYLTLSGIPISSKMSAFLNDLNSFSLFPNAFSYFIKEKEGTIPYSQAKSFGFDTDLILLNQGDDFTLILASIFAFPAVFLFSRCSYRWLGKKFKKSMRAYKYSFYLRFWIQCYLELGAAASIGISTFSNHNFTQCINIILCTFVFLLLVFTPPLYYLFSYKNKNRIQSREKSLFALFSTFYYEFRSDKGLLGTQFYFVFFSRRFIYIVSLVFLRNYPESEVTINIVLSLVTVLHLIFYWPFEDLILQINNLLTEILVLIVMCATSVYLFNLEQDIVTGVENAIILSVFLAIIVQFVSSVAIFSRYLYQVIYYKLKKSGIIKKIA